MGLPTVILPGYFAGTNSYQDLAKSVEQQGFPTEIVFSQEVRSPLS